MAPMDKFLQFNPSWDNNPSIDKSIDEWKSLFVMLSSCEEAYSEELTEKEMNFSTQLDITLILRTPRKTKTLTANTENVKLDGDYVTLFDILLEQQTSIIEVQK